MNIAFILYDGHTSLDFVGFYDAITRLKVLCGKDLRWDICALSEEVYDDRGLTMKVNAVKNDLSSRRKRNKNFKE